VLGLPAAWYRDPARATVEWLQAFAGGWQFVCHASDLPAAGTAARFDCAGRSAVVLRGGSGELRAFRNACRHRGARLIDGDRATGLAFCVDARLRCPYHGWTYDDTGALVAIPESQHYAALDRSTQGLYALPVQQWRGLVFVAFGPVARPLHEALDAVAAAWPDLHDLRRLAEPTSMACAADWKLACGHLLDAQHRGVARPGLKPAVYAAPAYDRIDVDAIGGGANLATEAQAAWSARAYLWLASAPAGAAARAGVVFLWPGTLLMFASDALIVRQVLPDVTGRCSLRELVYGAPDASRETRLQRYLHARVRRAALAMDLRLLERTQQGLGNLEPDDMGVIADSEPALHWFTQRAQHAFGGEARGKTQAAPRRTLRRKTVVPVSSP
jgi:phenylpropionate dioxygenase-like ring-hydroxylating dioxygenase large terminal subunit